MSGPLQPLLASWRLALRADGKSTQTVSTYLAAVTQFDEFLGSLPRRDDPDLAALRPVTAADLVRPAHVQGFMVVMLASHKPATANNRYRGLQQFFRWMVAEGEIEFSPMANLKPSTVPETPVPVISVEHIKLLKDASGRSFGALRDTAIIRLFCDTGIRRAEMAGLMKEETPDTGRVPHVDLDQQLLWVVGKGHRWRTLSIGSKSALAVDRYLRARRAHAQAWRPELWLGDKNRGPLTHWGIEQLIDRRCASAGIPNIHPHQFRHTWAHQMRQSGLDRGDLKRMGGWKSDQMVDRYGASAADGRAREAHRKRSFGDQL